MSQNPNLEPTSLPERQAARGTGIGHAVSLRPEIRPEKLPPAKSGAAWPRTLARYGGIIVERWQDNALMWHGGIRCTVNGAPRAYHPADAGAIAPFTEEKMRGAHAIVKGESGFVLQGARDPAPGFFVCRTAYQRTDYPPTDQRRYLDASIVLYMTVPLCVMIAAHEEGLPPILGADGLVKDNRRGYWFRCVVGDIDRHGIGAVSQKMMRDLSIGPRYFEGRPEGFTFKCWPGCPAPGYELQEWRPE